MKSPLGIVKSALLHFRAEQFFFLRFLTADGLALKNYRSYWISLYKRFMAPRMSSAMVTGRPTTI